MVFSDESRFCLGTHRIVEVMVWGAIGYGSRPPLVLIRDSMISVSYINEVLEPFLLL
jgi:hypothetical protein